MTEGQSRQLSLMENRRHNLEMERLGAQELATKAQQAQASLSQAETSLKQADVALINATTRQQELEATKFRYGSDFGLSIASFLLPDANTVLKSGAQVVSSLFS